MKSTERFASFGQFWPYYIGEHRHPLCRAMHFVGTGGFIALLIFSLTDTPFRMGVCLIGGLLVAFLARRIESKRRAGLEAISIALLWAIGNPWVVLGILWAYGWAWVGHFRVEHNRPATFQYPLWSLFGDFKMVAAMLSGRLWTGDPMENGSVTMTHSAET